MGSGFEKDASRLLHSLSIVNRYIAGLADCLLSFSSSVAQAVISCLRNWPLGILRPTNAADDFTSSKISQHGPGEVNYVPGH